MLERLGLSFLNALAQKRTLLDKPLHLAERKLEQRIQRLQALGLLQDNVEGWREPLRKFRATLQHKHEQATRTLGLQLLADEEAISQWTGGAVCPLRQIDLGLSETHGGAPPVARFITASGSELFFKPRNLKVDRAFTELLRALTVPSDYFREGIDLKVPEVLCRNAYGYAQAMPGHPMQSRANAEQAYFRMGCWLAIAQRVGASDLHFQNVIYHSDRPVIVDLETILQPPLVSLSGDRPSVSHTWLTDGPFSSSLVGPRGCWFRGQLHEMSSLGVCCGVGVNPDRYRVPVNSEISDEPVPPWTYIDTIAAAYQRTLAHLDRVAPEVIQRDDIFDLFAGVPVRLILRPSMLYGALLARYVHAIADGRDATSEFERLATMPCLLGSQWQETLALQEIKALSQLDVPAFYTTADATTLWLGDRPVRFQESAIARCRRLLATQSSPLLEWNTQLVHCALRLSASVALDSPWWSSPNSATNLLDRCVEGFRQYYLNAPDQSPVWLGAGATDSGELYATELFGVTGDLDALAIFDGLLGANQVLGDPILKHLAQKLQQRLARFCDAGTAQFPRHCLHEEAWEERARLLDDTEETGFPLPKNYAGAEDSVVIEQLCENRASASPYFNPSHSFGDTAYIRAFLKIARYDEW